MLKKTKKQSVSLDQIFDSIQDKTPCCQLDKGQIKFSVIFNRHCYCYDVLITNLKENFSFIFTGSEVENSSTNILTEVCLFFGDFNISKKDILKKGGCIQVKVPAKKVLPVLDKLHIFCPNDDETVILAEDFTGMDQKQINKVCLEIDDLDEFDDEYNV